MDNTKEKYISNVSMKDKPNKPIGLFLRDKSITANKIKDGAVTEDKIAEDSITTDKIKDGNVSYKKLNQETKDLIQAGTGLQSSLIDDMTEWNNRIHFLENNDISKQEHLTQIDEKNVSQENHLSQLDEKNSAFNNTLENITKTGEASAASNVTYNPNELGLTSTNVQKVIEETYKLSNIEDKDGNIVPSNIIQYIENSDEYIYALLDANKKLIVGISKETGSPIYGVGVPEQIKEYFDKNIDNINKFIGTLSSNSTLQELLDTKANQQNLASEINRSTNAENTLQKNISLKSDITDVEAKYKASNPNDGENVIASNTINLIKNSDEYIFAVVDSNDRFLFGIRKDNAKPEFPNGVSKQTEELFNGVSKQSNLNDGDEIIYTNTLLSTKQSEGYVEVHIDSNNKVLYGVEDDGNFYFGGGVPRQIQEYNADFIKETKEQLESLAKKSQELIDSNVDTNAKIAKEATARENADSNLSQTLTAKIEEVNKNTSIKDITYEQLSSSLKQRIDATGANITNSADDNWLANTSDNQITLKSSSNVEYVGKDIIQLTEDKTLENKLYFINHDIDLNGHTLNCSANTTLQFVGGKLINNSTTVATINGNGAGIIAGCTQIFNGSIIFDNNWNIPFMVEWFGAKATTNSAAQNKTAFDSSDAIQTALDCGMKDIIANSTYYIGKGLNITKGSMSFSFKNLICNGAYNALNVTNHSNIIKGNSLRQYYLYYNTKEERASKSAGIRFFGNSYNNNVDILNINWFGRGIWFNPRIGDGGCGSTSFAGIQYTHIKFSSINNCEEGIVFDDNGDNEGNGLWINENIIEGGRIGSDSKSYYDKTLTHAQMFCNYGIRHLQSYSKGMNNVNGNKIYHIGFEGLNVPIGELKSWHNCYFQHLRMEESTVAYIDGTYYPMFKLTNCSNVNMSIECTNIINTGQEDNIHTISGTTAEDTTNLIGNNGCIIDISDRLYVGYSDSAKIVLKKNLFNNI